MRESHEQLRASPSRALPWHWLPWDVAATRAAGSGGWAHLPEVCGSQQPGTQWPTRQATHELCILLGALCAWTQQLDSTRGAWADPSGLRESHTAASLHSGPQTVPVSWGNVFTSVFVLEEMGLEVKRPWWQCLFVWLLRNVFLLHYIGTFLKHTYLLAKTCFEYMVIRSI